MVDVEGGFVELGFEGGDGLLEGGDLGLDGGELALFFLGNLAGFSGGLGLGEGFGFEALQGVQLGGGERGALFLVVAVVAGAEVEAAFTFKGEQAVADAVEEIAVVADDEDAAGEGEHGFFEDAHGLQVEVVGGLIEDEEVAAAAEDFGEEDAALLAAGEFFDPHGDAVVGKEEAFEVGADVEFFIAKGDELGIASDFFHDTFGGVKQEALLIDVVEDGFFADGDFAFVGVAQAHEEPE